MREHPLGKLEVTLQVRYIGRHIHYQPRKYEPDNCMCPSMIEILKYQVGTLFRFD